MGTRWWLKERLAPPGMDVDRMLVVAKDSRRQTSAVVVVLLMLETVASP